MLQNNINLLEIHDKQLFRKIYNSLYSLSCGEIPDENIEIYDSDNEPVKAKDILWIIPDILTFDLSDKKLQSALYKTIEKAVADDAECFESLQNIYDNLCETLMDAAGFLDFDFSTVEELNTSKALKFVDFRLNNVYYSNVMDKLLCIISVISSLFPQAIIALINIKSFFDYNELEILYKHILYNKLTVILIESSSDTVLLQYENKLIIDDQFEEFKQI